MQRYTCTWLSNATRKAYFCFCKGIAWSLIALIVGLRPLLGHASCCYAVGCTQFAVIQMELYPVSIALKNIIIRLCTCNPLYMMYRRTYGI